MKEELFSDLCQKRNELKGLIDTIEEKITRIQLGSVSSCNAIIISCQEIIKSVQEYDHGFFSEGIHQKIADIKEGVESLDRVFFDDVSKAISSEQTETKQNPRPADPEWWRPFVNLEERKLYVISELSQISGYPIGQIKKNLQKHRIMSSKPFSNVWTYDGSELARMARRILHPVSSNPEEKKSEIDCEIHPDKVYTPTDLVFLLGIPYARVMKKFGDFKSARNEEGKIGFRGQDLLSSRFSGG